MRVLEGELGGAGYRVEQIPDRTQETPHGPSPQEETSRGAVEH